MANEIPWIVASVVPLTFLVGGGTGVFKASLRSVDDEAGTPIVAILATTDHSLIFDGPLKERRA